ncbi:class I SAM-dependent methyltransferase [Diaphorobacter aerolatus]|uniref:Class I SAM-dependent methyltransferase n=1 Tax=Diaphorobacter aerolatus TaxID=1288495 RepID=A0A7H0GNT9_9BURK|nr:class I SAM-dependent methyltransferase [Diaphorobacter aerolatus]QNP49955.1 class I SAM-dependent methyltransferase [Diaphorobacter aerolatus]
MSSSENTQAAQSPIESAQALIARGDMNAAGELLTAARDVAATRLAAHNLIEAKFPLLSYGQWMGCPCEISEADDIYKFFADHPSSLNPIRDYLADGWRTMSELVLLLEEVNHPLLRTRSFLEFASGHGRFTRHLVKALGADRVVVSDVVADSVSFARAAFNVNGFVSAAVPEHVQWSRQHDAVFVLSLFSHLPASTWSRWLRRIYDMVAPGGVLVFTTHGAEAVRRTNVPLDAEGFFFTASSESNAIEGAEYGTAFTSQQYVENRIAEHLPGARILKFAPQHFWHHQDAWVVEKPE